MGAAQKKIDKQALRSLVPLNALSDENFSELFQKTAVEDIPPGRTLFEEGDRDNRTVYILSGKVALTSKGAVVETIVGGSEQARYPIAHHLPRQVTALAKSRVTAVRIDTGLLDVLLHHFLRL